MSSSQIAIHSKHTSIRRRLDGSTNPKAGFGPSKRRLTPISSHRFREECQCKGNPQQGAKVVHCKVVSDSLHLRFLLDNGKMVTRVQIHGKKVGLARRTASCAVNIWGKVTTLITLFKIKTRQQCMPGCALFLWGNPAESSFGCFCILLHKNSA